MRIESPRGDGNKFGRRLRRPERMVMRIESPIGDGNFLTHPTPAPFRDGNEN